MRPCGKLVVLYDEHGGFYDHVVPPATIPPDHHVEEYGFRQFGVRVPAILVSPYVKKEVIHTQFDHTSLLKYLSEKWFLGPLGARVAAAESFGPNIHSEVQDLGPASISEPSAAGGGDLTYGRIQSRVQPILSGHQSALVAMTQLLESMTDVEAHSAAGRINRLITGFDGAVDVAVERVEDFLGQQREHRP
jgi:Phosphoesterase family